MAKDLRDRFLMKRHSQDMSNGAELPKSFGFSGRNFWQKKSKKDVSLDTVVDGLFKKQFRIDNTDFVIPNPERMFAESPWEIPELKKLKTQLNEIKNRLNDYNISDWHRHTTRRNRAGDVQWRLRKEVDPEFLTQAWCKFYENISLFPLIPKSAIEDRKLLSIHLCEAPGAFITSLNHWLKLNAPTVEWDWIATTLNPYYEGNPLSCMINDDRFIISSLEKWCFGSDYTGNLMSLKNVKNLVEKSREKGKVLLVTADGSIDCTNDPGEQESIVAPLHFCEAVTGMQLLSEHGSLLLKIFTIFEHDSLCLVFLLSCLFRNIYVNKPVTSKEGNSETYLICLDYRGPDFALPYLSVLTKYYEKSCDKSIFSKSDIPENFFNQMISCGEFFKNCQSEVIMKNIETYRHDEDNSHFDAEIKNIKRAVATRFIITYGIRKLETESLEVVGKTQLARIQPINLDPRIPDGSYNGRRVMENLDPKSLFSMLRSNLNLIETQAAIRWFTFSENLDTLHIRCGKPFPKVESSKFCMGKFLKIRNRVFDLLEKLGIEYNCNNLESIRDFINETESDEANNYKYLSFKESVHVNNHKTLNKINKKLKSISKGDSLVLIGYSLLTQLNVGVLYLLAHTFKSLGIIMNEKFGCIIILKYNLLNHSILECFKEVHKAIIKAEAVGETVLSVLPITKLCEGDLYSSVVQANHWSIKHYVNNVGDFEQRE